MGSQSTTIDPEAAGLDPRALERLRRAIERDIDADRHHGAVVLVARHGKVGFHEAIGKTDKAAGRDAALDDRFWLASVSKSLTAAALLRLVDRGELELHTRVAEVIPEFGVRGKARVTVYHLLTHTAGTWAGFLPPPPLQWGEVIGDLSAFASAISAQAITGRPGEHVVYNPFADFTILGEIVHRVDGRRFRDVVHEDLLAPLGMPETSFGLDPAHPNRVPIRMAEHSPGAAEVDVMHSLNELVHETAEIPAGGAFATVRDLFAFAEMLRLGGTSGDVRLLSPAIVEYALRNHTGDKVNQFWDFSKEDRGIDEFPANFMLCGGYVRGTGSYHLTPLGYTASPRSFGAVGSGSTMWMVDPERGLTFVFLSSGLMEGLGHFRRLQRLSDLALAAVTDGPTWSA